jgi:chromosome segregation ATPase
MIEYSGWILLIIVLAVLIAKGKVDLNDILAVTKLREANKNLQALANSLSGQLEEANKTLAHAKEEIKVLQDKVVDLSNQIKESGEKVVEQVKDSGEKLEETVKESTSKVEDTIKDRSEAVNEKIDDTINKAKDVLNKYKGFIKK